jgi:hypothetical protein
LQKAFDLSGIQVTSQGLRLDIRLRFLDFNYSITKLPDYPILSDGNGAYGARPTKPSQSLA